MEERLHPSTAQHLIAPIALLFALAALPPQDLVEDLCVDCHRGTGAEAGFDLQALLGRETLASGLFDWRRARAMVESGAMPPPSGPEDPGGLDDGERAEILGFLDGIESQALELGGHPGHEGARRLTRAELGNALQEILGSKVAIEDLMPEELVANNGFEASPDTLLVHPTWLARAAAAVRLTLDAALPNEGPTSIDPLDPDLGALIRSAFRRPVTDDELARYRGALTDRRMAGASPRESLRATLVQILASPHFLLRLEDSTAATDGEARPVSAHGLASRLSFLVWVGPPDAELLDLADSGRLLDPAVLDAQLARLLADPRALRFGRSFAGQWLGTRSLGTRVKPDPIDVAFMTDSVMADMRDEVARFLLELFRADLPLDELLLGEFSYVTRELAEFYGLEDPATFPAGAPTRVAAMPAQRRGLLTKAGVLATTAYPDRTSPVLRGAWILDDLLGTPPPPPPPDAGELDEELFEEAEEPGLRGALAAHRRQPSCASCHARIDPLGFALEGYDQFGRARTHDWDGEPVDARGELPDGTSFAGPDGLAAALLRNRRSDLAREIARRFLRYSLGRPLAWQDERAVVELSQALRDGGFGALLRATVASRPFRWIEPR